MQDNFKIRKNKSQKDMPLCPDSKLSPHYIHKMHKNKQVQNLQTSKSNHLEPLLKNKASLLTHPEHSGHIRLDNTQPVPHRTSSLNKYEVKHEGFHLIPLDINIPAKTSHLDK